MQPVERTGLHQRLEGRLVHRAEVATLAEVEHVAERTGLARLEDRADRRLAGALDRLEPEPDVAMARVAGLVGTEDHGEVLLRQVQVGRPDLDAHVGARRIVVRPRCAAALIEVDRPLLDLAGLALEAQHRRHVLRREVGLEVRRLVGHDRVAARVALVEAVARETQDEVEEPVGLLRVHAAVAGPLHERGARAVDHVLLLLRDRLDDRVCLAQRDPAEVVQHLHHLLLVDHDPVGLGGEAIDDLVHRRHRLAAVLASVVVGDQVHRTRAEECVRRDQVFDAVRLHVDQQSPHAA